MNTHILQSFFFTKRYIWKFKNNLKAEHSILSASPNLQEHNTDGTAPGNSVRSNFNPPPPLHKCDQSDSCYSLNQQNSIFNWLSDRIGARVLSFATDLTDVPAIQKKRTAQDIQNRHNTQLHHTSALQTKVVGMVEDFQKEIAAVPAQVVKDGWHDVASAEGGSEITNVLVRQLHP